MTTDTKEVELAKQLFLDAVNGRMGMSEGMVESLAKAALAYADLFYKQVQPPDSADIVTFNSKGCPDCFGSGGKRTSPCKKCKGTVKVPA